MSLRDHATDVMTRAGLAPDPWQQQVLTSTMAQMLLLCTRQAGKSTVAAALAVRAALLQAGALVLVLSPSLRQSGELFRKVLGHFNALGRPVPVTGESALRVEFANGSRVVSLPGDEGTIRGIQRRDAAHHRRGGAGDGRPVFRRATDVGGQPWAVGRIVDAVRPARLVLRGLAIERRVGTGAGHGQRVPPDHRGVPRGRAADAGRTLVPARVHDGFHGGD